MRSKCQALSSWALAAGQCVGHALLEDRVPAQQSTQHNKTRDVTVM